MTLASSGPGTGRPEDEQGSVLFYTCLGVAFLAFAIWGSLFPFSLRPITSGEASAAFWSAWGDGPRVWSRSDFLSNVLLFLPLGLFGASAIDVGAGGGRTAALRWLALFASGVALSLALEITQAFIPARTSSVVDVLAESLGMAAGIALRRAARRPMDAVARAVSSLIAHASWRERVLLAYSALFAVAWLLPLDVTIRPGEIADKYIHKRLMLPWSGSPDADSWWQLAAAFVGALPLGFAAMTRGRRQTRRSGVAAFFVVVLAICALEALQVFVYSRNTDSTVLFPAAGGVLVGVLVAITFPSSQGGCASPDGLAAGLSE